jgi:hypothetical protein
VAPYPSIFQPQIKHTSTESIAGSGLGTPSADSSKEFFRLCEDERKFKDQALTNLLAQIGVHVKDKKPVYQS